tara:strand:- start:758 stop:1378 length:621 start_codon:yes stop_codon:yes gene_type:complete
MSKRKYVIIRNIITKDVADFLFSYIKLREKALLKLKEKKLISTLDASYGTMGDPQIKDNFSIYGDPAFDNLLLYCKDKIEKEINLKLIPNYSYARLYKKGAELVRHKDRFSCEITTTLNLGGDHWPIYIEPSGQENLEGVKVDLNPGDMVIYRGDLCEHWREVFDKEICGQVFLHYNNIETDPESKNIYDTRPYLGMPSFSKTKNG